jgi:glycosyltransferase involved in cell wall biosynthesis
MFDPQLTASYPRTVQSVTVVIPCYRCGSIAQTALEHARDSLVAFLSAQPDRRAELLLVDDASTDDSAQAVEAVFSSWSPIVGLEARVLRLEANRGPGGARNAGVAAASGDVIAFCDADDLFLPSHISDCAGALDLCPGLCMAATLACGLTLS